MFGCVGEQVGQKLRQSARITDHVVVHLHADLDVLAASGDGHLFHNLFQVFFQRAGQLQRDGNTAAQTPPGEIKHVVDQSIHSGNA